jgi:cytochrome c peroxidase
MARQGRTWADVRTKLQQVEPLRLASNLPSDMVAALQQNPTYASLFAAAFGDPAISAKRIAFALASYQRTQIPDDTPWDRYTAGDPTALDETELAGWLAFQSAARCVFCHPHPVFSDDMFHNLGVRFAAEDLAAGPSVRASRARRVQDADAAQRRPAATPVPQRPEPGARRPEPGERSQLGAQRLPNGGGVDPSNLDLLMAPLESLGVPERDLDDILEFVRTA